MRERCHLLLTLNSAPQRLCCRHSPEAGWRSLINNLLTRTGTLFELMRRTRWKTQCDLGAAWLGADAELAV